MVDCGETAQYEKPDGEGRAARRGRHRQARRARAEEENGKEVAPSEPVGHPAGRQRQKAEGEEGAGRQSDQLRIGEAALRRDGDDCGREDQDQEMIQRMRDIDKENRARGEVGLHEIPTGETA